MTVEELNEKLNELQKQKYESQTLELKKAQNECPKRLYDTLSAFSNQDEGGVIIFGIDEENGYAETGVYDPQDLQRKINAQCLQMEPVVRPLLTVLEKDGKFFVSAEIPAIDVSERPCYYRGKGKNKGSYIRVGDSDEPMTEYEIYSYEAFRKRYRDETRPAVRMTKEDLDGERLEAYLKLLRQGKPNLSALPEEKTLALAQLVQDGVPSLYANLLFGLYPQAFFPQLCIAAVVVPGSELGETGAEGERFSDNERIEGTIPQMLAQALQFVRRNSKMRSIIHPDTGRREDRPEYPPEAVREAVVNALVHRDYSIHTEGMPIQLHMFSDRLEIQSPGGLYGRIRVNQLGRVQPDTRNPHLAAALELLGITENRYSGIPLMERAVGAYQNLALEMEERRGSFCVTFRQKMAVAASQTKAEKGWEESLLAFCRTPRSKQEIAAYLGIKTLPYAMKKYVAPLLQSGRLRLSIPEQPRSHRQRYMTV